VAPLELLAGYLATNQAGETQDRFIEPSGLPIQPLEPPLRLRSRRLSAKGCGGAGKLRRRRPEAAGSRIDKVSNKGLSDVR